MISTRTSATAYQSAVTQEGGGRTIERLRMIPMSLPATGVHGRCADRSTSRTSTRALRLHSFYAQHAL